MNSVDEVALVVVNPPLNESSVPVAALGNGYAKFA